MNCVISLRTLREDDAEVLASYANNPRIAVNLRDGFPHPYMIGHAIEFIRNFGSNPDANVRVIECDGKFCGVIGLHRQADVYYQTAEIGYWIAEPFWGKGIATEAVRQMTAYGFETMGLLRIHTGVFEYNPSSMRVLEKNGYVRDGIFRKSVTKMGKVWDEFRYSIIRETN